MELSVRMELTRAQAQAAAVDAGRRARNSQGVFAKGAIARLFGRDPWTCPYESSSAPVMVFYTKVWQEGWRWMDDQWRDSDARCVASSFRRRRRPGLRQTDGGEE